MGKTTATEEQQQLVALAILTHTGQAVAPSMKWPSNWPNWPIFVLKFARQ
ncbi:hypothetical protein [Pontibacter rugosus]|uniref:Uncharacterized protein n=1 Tax=Pontibacter rugosus TaxID=1745966 RepID=A0ABW3SLG0_9BACT